MGVCNSRDAVEAHDQEAPMDASMIALTESKTASDIADGSKSMRVGTSHGVALSSDTFELKSQQQGVTLYVGRYCPFSLRCQIALAEKGTQHNTVVIEKPGKEAPKDFLAIQPSGVVPVLVHDGKVVPDSWDILKYIEANQMRILSNTSSVHRQTIAATPSLIPIPIYDTVVNKYQQIESLQKALSAFLTTKNPSMIPKQAESFTEELKTWDAAITGPYFFGKDFTVVDIGLWSLLCRLPALKYYKKYDVPDELVKLNAWLEHVRKRPSVSIHRYKDDDLITYVERMARPGPIALMNSQHAALRSHMNELQSSHKNASSLEQRAAWLTSLFLYVTQHLIHARLEDTVFFDILRQLQSDIILSEYTQQHRHLDESMQQIQDEIKAYDTATAKKEEEKTPQGEPEASDANAVWMRLGEKLVTLQQEANKHMDAEELSFPPLLLPLPWEQQSTYIIGVLNALSQDEAPTFISWLVKYQPDVAAVQFVAKSLKFVYAEKHPEVYQQYVTVIKAAVSSEMLTSLTPIL